VATVIAWRESPLERATRVGAAGGSSVACPTCGYNLTGLAEARCPECGGRFTLDELFAAQPARGVASELG
jgi:DNA-directed RNA polymerase subunit RPC12/RpoP